MARRKAANADDVLRQMFPDLPTSDDFVQEEKAKPDAQAEKIAALEAQLNQLASRSPIQVAQPVERQAQVQMPQVPVVDYSNMPDPLQDPKGYAQWNLGNVQRAAQFEKDMFVAQQQAASQASERTNALWSGYARAYPVYAANEERAEIAATKVLQRVKAAGQDVETYMGGNKEAFYLAVNEEYTRIFGKPTEASGDDDDTDDDDDDGLGDNRTQMLGGGAAGPGGPQKVREAPQKFGALSNDILDWQRKTGFIR